MAKNKTRVIAEPGKQELLIIREIDAPREQVFKAFVDPKLFTQWLLGPKKHDLAMTLERFEPRAGGSWRYTHKDQQGNVFGFHGVNHEVLAPERIIQTSEFEGMPEKGHVSLDTARFEELPGGRTRVTIQSVLQSVEDRDMMVKSGMEEGVNDSFDRLEALTARTPQVMSAAR